MKAGIEVLAGDPRAALAGDRRHGRARARPRQLHAEIGGSRASTASIACSRWPRCRAARSRPSARAREWFADAEALVARAGRRAHARSLRAGQGLAQESAGARGRGAAQRPRARASQGGALMLYWLAKLLTPVPSRRFNVFSLPDAARDPRGAHRARDLLLRRSVDDRRSWRGKVGQVVRDDGPKTHLSKAGTPTMGGTLILVAIVAEHAALGGPRQPLRVDRARRDVRLRADRLLGRLPQARDEETQGLIARYKYFWQSLVGLGAAVACSTPRRRPPRPRCTCRSSRTSRCRWAPRRSSRSRIS